MFLIQLAHQMQNIFGSQGIIPRYQDRATMARLYAVGEVARTGVHGANRLASNSLLEGLVFAGRIGLHLEAHLAPQGKPVNATTEPVLLDPAVRPELARAVVKSGYDLLEMRPVGVSLEDIEAELTRRHTTPKG